MARRWLVLPLAAALMVAGCSVPGLSSSAHSSTGSGASAAAQPASATVGPTGSSAASSERRPANYLLIVDASGSMLKSDVGGGTRMAAAQDAASKFVSSLPKGSRVGLVSYGDKTLEEAPRSAGCGDVSLKVPVGSDIGAVTRQVKTLRPVGWTPIGKALQTAAAQAKGQPLNVVLITDGEDSCAPPDPCQTAATLAADNAGLSISAIGLNASSDQLSCIASKGKGYFVTASNSAQLARRLEALGDPDAASRTFPPLESSRSGPDSWSTRSARATRDSRRWTPVRRCEWSG
ncbi:vWA domain-containing protein [Acidipropionibacterium jensenii]|uniref:vWA domain-containing protein n=1 Tax=Acidipropionibacterium jensenii TaxID=1749 RepID=UPI0034516153